MEMNKTWPSLDRYQIAVQSPQNFFRDPRLKDSVVERRGIFPTTRSGNFGSVYKFTESYGRSWAVKVFIKAIAQRQSRYEMISKESGITKVKQLLWFEYQPEGILVDGQWYPLLLMEWGAGDTLIDFCKERFEERQTEVDNAALSTNWIRLMHDLETIGVAHGDLQHGNILVTENGEMTLVDYDGMYVSAMQGEKALELGVPAYQHPQRNDDFFNARLDDFSAMAILVQLMSMNRKLWQTYHKDDGHLLLTQEDIKSPDSSPLFRELLASSNLLIKGMTESLLLSCKSDIRLVPKFSEVLNKIQSLKQRITQKMPVIRKEEKQIQAPPVRQASPAPARQASAVSSKSASPAPARQTSPVSSKSAPKVASSIDLIDENDDTKKWIDEVWGDDDVEKESGSKFQEKQDIETPETPENTSSLKNKRVKPDMPEEKGVIRVRKKRNLFPAISSILLLGMIVIGVLTLTRIVWIEKNAPPKRYNQHGVVTSRSLQEAKEFREKNGVLSYPPIWGTILVVAFLIALLLLFEVIDSVFRRIMK